MTVTYDAASQILAIEHLVRRVAKVEYTVGGLVQAKHDPVYTDEWLHREMQELQDRLSLPNGEILSELNAMDKRVCVLEDTLETILARIKRLEEAVKNGKPLET